MVRWRPMNLFETKALFYTQYFGESVRIAVIVVRCGRRRGAGVLGARHVDFPNPLTSVPVCVH